MNYTYTLLTAFGIAPEVFYSLLPPPGKVANTIGITWHASVCRLTPDCFCNVLCKFFLYVMAT